MCARRFLGFVFFLILLVVAGASRFINGAARPRSRQAVPQGHFEAARRVADPIIPARRAGWRDPGAPDDPCAWLPDGVAPDRRAMPRSSISIPTTYLEPTGGMRRSTMWARHRFRTRLFLQSQASAFNGAGQDLGAALPPGRLWRVPAQERGRRRRRSTLPMATSPPRSTSSSRRRATARSSSPAIARERCTWNALLREKIAGKPIARRIVAAYVVGWPVSTTSDLPALGLPACAAPDQTACILSWMSFGEPANSDLILEGLEQDQGIDRRRTAAGGRAVRQSGHGHAQRRLGAREQSGDARPVGGPSLGRAPAGPRRSALR